MIGDLAAIASDLSGVATCLFCLGTSVRNIKGEAEYREIHVNYALAAARIGLRRCQAIDGANTVSVSTSSGASALSGSMEMQTMLKLLIITKEGV